MYHFIRTNQNSRCPIVQTHKFSSLVIISFSRWYRSVYIFKPLDEMREIILHWRCSLFLNSREMKLKKERNTQSTPVCVEKLSPRTAFPSLRTPGASPRGWWIGWKLIPYRADGSGVKTAPCPNEQRNA